MKKNIKKIICIVLSFTLLILTLQLESSSNSDSQGTNIIQITKSNNDIM